MITVRNWFFGHGRMIARVGVTGINARSTAYASVCEWSRDGDFGFMGDARFTVCSVVPGPGYVDVWVQVDWGSDLEFRVSVLYTGD